MQKRHRLRPEQSRTLILDAAQRILSESGAGSLSFQRVAAEAGLKAPLVRYYYQTIEELLVGLYRHVGERHLRNITAALESDHPVRALWRVNTGKASGMLMAEMISLGHKHEAVRAELIHQIELIRKTQALAFRTACSKGDGRKTVDPDAAVFLLMAAATTLVTDRQIGINQGHDQVLELADKWIECIEPTQQSRK